MTNLTDHQVASLLKKREQLLKELEDLGLRPVGRSEAARRFDEEDKLKLAKLIIKIDKKLGRL